MPKSIHEFMQQADGTRLRQIEWSEGVKVMVRANSREVDDEAALVTQAIAGIEETLAGAQATIVSMVGELRKAKALVPLEKPTRLLGTGYVRMTPRGEICLLGGREKGFGHFGYGFDSWDTLFRTFDVKIVEVGTDEHGPWWRAENV
jgi:hypothetical protein